MNRNGAKGPGIVITYPYPLGGISGGSRMTREIAIHLSRLGADVTVMPVSTNPLVRRFPRQAPERELLGHEFDETLREAGVELLRVPQNAVYYQLDGLSIKRSLKALLKRKRVDAVLSYYHEGAFLPDFLRSKGIKFAYVSTWQTYEPIPARGTGLKKAVRGVAHRWLNRRTVTQPYRRADVYFATSNHTKTQIVELLGVPPERVVICPLGVDPGFLEVPIEKPQAITRLIFFGRIVRMKGFLDAIEALGMLTKKGLTDWTYRLHGEGRPEWALEAAREHGVEDKIVLCGPADDATLKRELGEAHLAIMPSYAEAFGLSFAESQAAGVPVVAYDVGSLPEVIEDGVTGWLAPLRDVRALADNIERAMRDPEGTYQAGLNGRQRVASNFTWERTAATILEGLGLEVEA